MNPAERDDVQFRISRRRLLQGGVGVGVLALAGAFYLRSETTSTATPAPSNQGPGITPKEATPAPDLNSDPDLTGRVFAQAALDGNFEGMLELLAPDTRRMWSSMFTKRGLKVWLGDYTCSSGGRIASDPAFIRASDKNSIGDFLYATYKIEGECQKRSQDDKFLVPVKEVVVVLETVKVGGRERYYPQRTDY